MIKAILNFFGVKSLGGQSAVFGGNEGEPSENLEDYAKEGYIRNIIVYKCIYEIASAISALDFEAYRKNAQKEEVTIDNAPILGLLDEPNLAQDKLEFFFYFVLYYMCFGSAYLEKMRTSVGPQLFLLEPHRVTIEKDINSILFPREYLYQPETGGQRRFLVNQITGESDIMHFKNPHPLDRFKGLPPLSPCAYSTDIFNFGMKWNRNLLNNAAVPSGVIQLGQNMILGENQRQQIKEQFSKFFGGFGGAGKVPVMDGGMEFKPASMTSKDMDYIQLIEMTARNIGSALGVPFALIVPDAATYSNMQTAREMFYETTVLPLTDRILSKLSRFLSKDSGGIKLRYNIEKITALEGRREKTFNRMVTAVGAGIVTRNEAREELEYEPAAEEEADKLYIPSSQTPLEMSDEEEQPLIQNPNMTPLDSSPKEGEKPPKESLPQSEENDEEDNEEELEKMLRKYNFSKTEIFEILGK